MSHYLVSVFGLSAFAFLLNIPLGRWRVSVEKFSVSWFLAVHLSIPLVLLLRLKMGLSAWFIPFTIVSAIAGQLIGGYSAKS